MNLSGKFALVTGSTRGIGLGIAQRLAAAGATLILNGCDDPTAALDSLPPGTGFHGADLAQPQQIEALFAYAARDFGGVDILVNNAGIQHVAPLQRFPVARWDAIIALNLSAVFHATRLALPGMQARDWGRIVNIASVHSLVASTGKAAYVAAKHGVVGLTKVTALETARTGITCNALCPGFVLTPLIQQQLDDQGGEPVQARQALLADKQPSHAFVTPALLGELALFLCSDAAAQVRGAAWTIDGGWTTQ